MESSNQPLPETDVTGLKIFTGNQQELVQWISQRFSNRIASFVATPYAEFLHQTLINPEFKLVLSDFDVRIPDGISIQWASTFLKKPLSFKPWYVNLLQAFAQVGITGAQILLNPESIRKEIPNKITGSDFIWDLAQLAEQRTWKIFLAGGFSDTPEIVKQKLQVKFPHIQIVGTSNINISSNRDSEELLNKINASGADALFLCLGAFKQERWLMQNKKNLPNIMFAIGLGGTFDYIAGVKSNPPRWIRKVGLEWLYRLFTQPERLPRIWNAVVGLIMSLVKWKMYSQLPFRENVVCAIENNQGEILIARRARSRDHWQLPQGGVDKFESLEETALRESHEEVGLRNLIVTGVQKQVNSYIFPTSFLNLWKPNKYKGQTQSIVFLKYSGDPRAVQVDDREFDSYAWVKKDKLVDSVHTVRREIAKRITQHLRNL